MSISTTSPSVLIAAVLNDASGLPLTDQQRKVLDGFNSSTGSLDGINPSSLLDILEYDVSDNPKWLTSKQRLKEAFATTAAVRLKKAKTIRLYRRLAIAASLVAVTSIFLYKFNTSRSGTGITTPLAGIVDFPPGESRATLTLPDQETITLGKATTGRLVNIGGAQLEISKSGTLSYFLTDRFAAPATNILTTPKAGTFTVLLSDGSSIHLDAESSIAFPVPFQGNYREVKLIRGQAYFDVAKNKTPFIVRNEQFKIDVLGTKFNVNTYGKTVKTTLLQGEIKFSSDSITRQLAPNQQLELDKQQQQITVQDLPNNLSTLWMDGYFSFVDQDLRSMMQQIERWYNVDIRFEGDIPDTKRTLRKLTRNVSLEQTLKTLSDEQTLFKYEILENRKVVIRK